MKLSLSKSSLPVVLVVAALAAGTVLVAGYAEGPDKAVKAAAESKCGTCPLSNTESCCEAKAGASCETTAAVSCCGKATCEGESAGACGQKAEAASRGESASDAPAKGACAAGGCPFSQ